jgi:ankyrin repeat protein
MSTAADLLGRVEEWQKQETEIPSSMVFDLLTPMVSSEEALSMSDFNRLVELASDQSARWQARWHFSSATSPDEEARSEAASWEYRWERWSEMLCAKVPAARDSVAETHKWARIQRVLEKSEAGRRGRRTEEITAAFTSQVAILLDRIGLGIIARPLYTAALYPPGTVGRIGPPPLDAEESYAPSPETNGLLVQAATCGSLDSVEKLIDVLGVDVDTMDETGITPLMMAATNGHDAVVECLLSRGADLLLRDELGGTALHCACMNGAPSTVALLVSKGANLHACDRNGRPPHFHTAFLDNVPVLEWLLAHGIDRESRDDSGATLLFLAATLGKCGTLQSLIAAGANLETRNNGGETPLLSSLSHSRRESATLLLDHGANRDAIDGNGANALHHVAFGGLLGLTRKLLELGCNPNVVDGSGCTPLHVSVSRGFPTIQLALVGGGADSSMKTGEGKSICDLEQEAVGLREMTEKMRLLRALPPEIGADDMAKLADLADMCEAKGEGAEYEMRAFLEDLVHAYQIDPSRGGQDAISMAEIIDMAMREHPGET